MICDNCQQPIDDPIDHEFCKHKVVPSESAKKSKRHKLEESTINPAKMYSEYDQKPITHEFAPASAKPPNKTKYVMGRRAAGTGIIRLPKLMYKNRGGSYYL